MDINDQLYVEIHPLASGQIPHPHPVNEAGFDLDHVYKVLGMYNPSETSECYMVLTNTKRQIWFIPQRHLLAWGLIDSDEFFLSLDEARALKNGAKSTAPQTAGRLFLDNQVQPDLNGHSPDNCVKRKQIS